jgi:hypothetical protein
MWPASNRTRSRVKHFMDGLLLLKHPKNVLMLAEKFLILIAVLLECFLTSRFWGLHHVSLLFSCVYYHSWKKCVLTILYVMGLLFLVASKQFVLNFTVFYEIWGSHGGESVHGGLMGVGAVLTSVQPWRWRQYVPPKSWYPPTYPHGVKPQKTTINMTAFSDPLLSAEFKCGTIRVMAKRIRSCINHKFGDGALLQAPDPSKTDISITFKLFHVLL